MHRRVAPGGGLNVPPGDDVVTTTPSSAAVDRTPRLTTEDGLAKSARIPWLMRNIFVNDREAAGLVHSGFVAEITPFPF